MAIKIIIILCIGLMMASATEAGVRRIRGSGGPATVTALNIEANVGVNILANTGVPILVH